MDHYKQDQETKNMTGRIEIMRDAGVLECPDWCTQDEDEPAFEQHVGDWHDILADADAGADRTTTVRARPRRDWFDGAFAYAEIDWQAGTNGCPEWFGSGEVQALTAGLAEVDEQANDVQEWMWAYDGADEDAAVLDAAVG